MKRWLTVLLLTLLVPGIVLAQDTAYKALKTVGKQRGERALNQVIQMVGQAGRTQPVSWNVSLGDPVAGGGIQELEITSGVIASERNRVHAGGINVPPIDLTKLNVDSDGAFRLAEQEAARNQVAFDSVNYRLSTDGPSNQPVWTLDIIDAAQRPVGMVRIAADTGTLIRAGNWVANNGNSAVARRRSFDGPGNGSVGQTVPPAYPDRPVSDYRDPAYQDQPSTGERSGETVGERANRYGASVVHFGEKVADKTVRAARKVGGWFQKKFTGRNELDDDDTDRQYDTTEPPPLAPDPYNQPVRPTRPE